ncbi:uncharacterized protein LOC143629212 [Bidens hawaiensis]|uniref:uncharacterized protein LOC143629212 n=1 Tax=Bidens hawaiensis TaxID=980011 RepID=UPI00404AB326
MVHWDDDMDTLSSTAAATVFDHYYLAYPLSHASKLHHETGNKIIMPASALNELATLSISFPMLFRIENTALGHHSHCGVVEFTADEGFVLLPTWMMNNMHLHEGELVNIKNTSLPKAEYIKLQPHATKFTALSDHKSLLEKAFRDFVCLTTGDTIVVNHGDEKYLIDIVETKPSGAVLLFETDCEVDFAPLLDYKEIEKKRMEKDHIKSKKASKLAKKEEIEIKKDAKPEMKEAIGFEAFAGLGRRLDGQLLTVVADDQEMVRSDVEVNVKIIKEDGFKAFTGRSYW